MKNNIALIHYSYPPVIGGVEFIMEGHARILVQNGHSVKIITGAGASRVPGINVQIIDNFTAEARAVKTVQAELQNGLVTNNFKELKQQLKQKIDEALSDIQVCFIHNVLSMHFNLALTAALREVIAEGHHHKKFYAWCHDASLNQKHYSLPEADVYPWQMLKSAQKNCRYIAISRLRQEELSKLFNVSRALIKVVPDGIDVKSFLGITDIAWTIALDLDLLNQDLVMFFPSRILKRKNYELAFKITGAIKNKALKCKLLLTGPPDPHNPAASAYLKELRLLIKDLNLEEEIVFIHDLKAKYGSPFNIGYLELQNFYSLSGLLLLTSSQEGFGMPLLEAAAKRLPIACSDIPAFREVVGEDALIFGLDEAPEQIACRVIEFIKKQPAGNMFRKLLADFSWEAVYRDYLKDLVL